MHELNPETFWAPSLNKISEIKVGDTVKVSDSKERFWVFVTEIRKDHTIFRGIIDNILTCE